MGKFRLSVATAMAKGKKSEYHVRQCWLRSRRSQSDQQGGSINFSETGHLLFACLISTTIGFLQVKAVFAAHSKNLWVSLVAMITYYLSFAAKKKILRTDRGSRYSQLLFDRFTVFWGALASISLVMVFLPPLPSWVFLPISAFLLTIVALLSLITQAACWVVRKVSILFMWIHGHAGGERRQRCYA